MDTYLLHESAQSPDFFYLKIKIIAITIMIVKENK